MCSGRRWPRRPGPRRVGPDHSRSWPACACVLEAPRLEISGTDLELTIQRTIEVNGEHDGACVVPGRLTAEAVRTLAPGR